MTIKKLLNDKFFALFLILGFALVLFWGRGFTSGVSRGLNLWATTVVPALLPYAFLSALLVNKNFSLPFPNKVYKGLGKVFNVGNCSIFAFLINLISGCPLGLKRVAELKEKGLVASGESVRACILCFFPSPMYLFTIGSLTFGHRRLGIALIIANILATLITAFVFSLFGRKEKVINYPLPSLNYQDAFFESIYSCLTTMLSLGVCLAIFSALVDALLCTNALLPLTVVFGKLFGNQPLANAFSVGLIESTWGVNLLRKVNHPLSFALSGVVSGLGGASTFIQTAVILKGAKIKTAPIYLAKVVQAVLNFLFCLAFCLF